MDLKKAVAIGLALTAATGLTVQQRQQHVDVLVPAFQKYDINTCDRVAAALAQFSHETGGYRWLKELGGPSYLRRYGGYHGRGYIHVTWEANYQAMERCTGLPLVKHPELLEKLENAALVSACWWKLHGLNEIADKRDIRLMTRVINGGYNGLDSRKKYYGSLLKAFDEHGICSE
jgi:putative chitinase